MGGDDAKEPIQSVQVFGRKKSATAVAYCKRGKGLIKVNGRPLELVQPEALSFKLQEPILLLGKDRFADIDIRIRVKGGGHTSQVYAIRQALSKLWLLITRSTLMSSPSRKSRISLCSLTGLCWLPTPGGTSPRSLEGRERAPDTRSPTVKSRWQNLSQCCYIPLCLLWLVV